MPKHHFALFSTPVGECALVWGRVGVVGLALPERDAHATRERLARHFEAPRETSPTADIATAMANVQQLLRGDRVDLSTIALDMGAVPPFHQRVYTAARDIPVGETITYGELARRIDSPQSPRAVGQALGRNPFAIIVPCHRIVSASGGLGGFTAHGGINTKERLLAIERGIVDLGSRGVGQLQFELAGLPVRS
jgi:O-6-methylguanine DNA methyltransferase